MKTLHVHLTTSEEVRKHNPDAKHVVLSCLEMMHEHSAKVRNGIVFVDKTECASAYGQAFLALHGFLGEDEFLVDVHHDVPVGTNPTAQARVSISAVRRANGIEVWAPGSSADLVHWNYNEAPHWAIGNTFLRLHDLHHAVRYVIHFTMIGMPPPKPLVDFATAQEVRADLEEFRYERALAQFDPRRLSEAPEPKIVWGQKATNEPLHVRSKHLGAWDPQGSLRRTARALFDTEKALNLLPGELSNARTPGVELAEYAKADAEATARMAKQFEALGQKLQAQVDAAKIHASTMPSNAIEIPALYDARTAASDMELGTRLHAALSEGPDALPAFPVSGTGRRASSEPPLQNLTRARICANCGREGRCACVAQRSEDVFDATSLSLTHATAEAEQRILASLGLTDVDIETAGSAASIRLQHALLSSRILAVQPRPYVLREWLRAGVRWTIPTPTDAVAFPNATGFLYHSDKGCVRILLPKEGVTSQVLFVFGHDEIADETGLESWVDSFLRCMTPSGVPVPSREVAAQLLTSAYHRCAAERRGECPVEGDDGDVLYFVQKRQLTRVPGVDWIVLQAGTGCVRVLVSYPAYRGQAYHHICALAHEDVTWERLQDLGRQIEQAIARKNVYGELMRGAAECVARAAIKLVATTRPAEPPMIVYFSEIEVTRIYGVHSSYVIAQDMDIFHVMRYAGPGRSEGAGRFRRYLTLSKFTIFAKKNDDLVLELASAVPNAASSVLERIAQALKDAAFDKTPEGLRVTVRQTVEDCQQSVFWAR